MFEPATPADLPAIVDVMTRMRLDRENLDVAQFIVHRRYDSILAFGRIKPYSGGVHELAGVAVVEDARGQGLGEAVVRELIRRFPTPDVWITTDLTAWFERFGFRTAPAEIVPAPLADKLARICGTLRTGVVAMHRPRDAA